MFNEKIEAIRESIKGMKLRREYCNNRKCYVIFINRSNNSFRIEGFSKYIFFIDGICLNAIDGSEIKQLNSQMEGKLILTNDKNVRVTLRINGILNFVMENL